ncbi:hypothetical protein [Janthinobacterium sp. LB3P118]|uniref:hypothetical protein n=1 Tax=Janthinobacterium sp. LB3P118 TaxID=3424195 RepID=UPI003F254E08
MISTVAFILTIKVRSEQQESIRPRLVRPRNGYTLPRMQMSPNSLSLLSGFRLVAADASTVRFGLRASHVKRAAVADQLVYGLFLPGAELMLSASLYSADVGERQMLFEQLDRLVKREYLPGRLSHRSRCRPARLYG